MKGLLARLFDGSRSEKEQPLKRIDLEGKTKPKVARIDSHWHENQYAGLGKTLFYRISIPLEAFDAGLEYEEQPVETEIVLDWFDLRNTDIGELDGLNLTHHAYPEAEGSVYIGHAHNPCTIEKLKITRCGDREYSLDCCLFFDFEFEGVGLNERFNFETNAKIVNCNDA